LFCINVFLKDLSKRVLHHNPLEYLECRDVHLSPSCGSKYLTKQHTETKPQLKNRASKDAQVLISCNTYLNDSMHIRHMHDMSIGDPFDQFV
jgi:hypothetical protein